MLFSLLAGAVAPAAAESLDIDIAAEIPARCGFAQEGPLRISAPGDLESAGTVAVRVGLDCNAPYALGITTEHGALVNIDSSEDGSGFAFRKDYGVSITLDTDLGVVRSSRCSASQLVPGGACGFAAASAGEGLESGQGISVGRDATLTFDWRDQSTEQSRLAPGRYRDTIILVVGARA